MNLLVTLMKTLSMTLFISGSQRLLNLVEAFCLVIAKILKKCFSVGFPCSVIYCHIAEFIEL